MFSELDGAHFRQELSGGEVAEEMGGEKKRRESLAMDLKDKTGESGEGRGDAVSDMGTASDDPAELDGGGLEHMRDVENTRKAGMG